MKLIPKKVLNLRHKKDNNLKLNITEEVCINNLEILKTDFDFDDYILSISIKNILLRK